MVTQITEATPRERLARIITLLKRTKMFWRGAAVIAVLGVGISLAIALHTKRAWRSETTIIYHAAIQTPGQESVSQRAARLGPNLKDMLYARPGLEQVVAEFNLFPEKRQKRGMLEAVEEMQLAVGFRARSGDSFVISFIYEDPYVAQQVTARLADLIISEYNRKNLDTATQTRDFLTRELEEANTKADEASRAYALFLTKNPQFQWGPNESPYAPTPTSTLGVPGAPLLPFVPSVPRPSDPKLAALYGELARIEAQLSPRAPGVAPAAPPASPELAAAQKKRDEAAKALSAAEAALADKLLVLTPQHPEAISAKVRVDAARRSLAAADAELRTVQRSQPQAPHEASAPDISPSERAELEKRRASLRQRIAARRVELARRPGQPASKGDTAEKIDEPEEAPDTVELETEWHRLRLELERAREQVRAVEAKAHSAVLVADSMQKQEADLAILDPAYRPTRPDRGRGRVFIAGATIAIFLAIAYAAARVMLNDTLLDESDVEALGGPQVLVSMPPMPNPPSSGERNITPARRAAARAEPISGITCAPPRATIVPAPLSIKQLGPASRAPRDVGTVTISFGVTPIEPAPPSPPPSPRREAAITLRGGASIVKAMFDEPEIEVIGVDVDPEGEDVHALLRRAPRGVQAALRVLRHRLEQRRAESALVVGVLSPGDGEGKTTLAVELALTLSEAERARVVLVEGNMEKPGVATALGLKMPREASLSAQIRQRMSGRGRPWGVIHLSPSLAVLADSPGDDGFPSALHSLHFEAAVQALRRNFDYVVIDGPRVLGSGDANVIEATSDGVLLVARAGTTRGAALCGASRQLGERRILGVVLRDAEPPAAGAANAGKAA